MSVIVTIALTSFSCDQTKDHQKAVSDSSQPRQVGPPPKIVSDLDKKTQAVSEVSPPKKVEPPSPPKIVSDLDKRTQDAVDLAIAQNAMSMSLNPLSISAALKQRLGVYDGRAHMDQKVELVENSFVDGCITRIKPGGSFVTKFEKALVAEISFLDGRVGIKHGGIFVQENTHALINGKPYIFTAGLWKKQH